VNIPFRRSGGIPTGITITAREPTTLGDVDGISSPKTAKGSGVEGPALSLPEDYSKGHKGAPKANMVAPVTGLHGFSLLSSLAPLPWQGANY